MFLRQPTLSVVLGVLATMGLGTSVLLSDEAATVNEDAAAMQFFETEIRPLLAEACYECHSDRASKPKGGLRLDSRAGALAGGDTGPALVPRNPGESMLIEAVRYEGLEMPPDRRLPPDQIAKLEKWIRIGAPFPGGEESATASRRKEFQITDEDRNYWAYRPIAKPNLPEVSDARWNRHPIDRLIYAKLAENGLSPSPSATPRQLARRLYFDLIGLPPSPEQIDGFAKDSSPANLSAMIEYLLSLPQYGERWGRHWLDVVRFAQSNGYERDGEKPMVWRYRDYVIRSFNEDKPYDRFVCEQLAGDELPDATAESVVATAFYRLGVWDDEPDDKRAAEFDSLDDMLSTMGQVFLGQTIGCARCHNHMFDPISQRDYYELLSFLRNVRFYENPEHKLSSATAAPLAAPAIVAQYRQQLQAKIAELETARAQADEAQKRQIDQSIKELREAKPPFQDWTLAIQEHGVTPHETFLLVRGDAGTPGAQVDPRFLSVLGNEASPTPEPAYGVSSGLRTQLANWVASPSNPLTARVIVNRIWQYHFGRGIVRTPNDLGKAGLPPTHPELLDWLAAELIENNWSIKHLHRTILRSQTWQMASASLNGPEQQADPSNDLFWRQNLRRLDAEAIRDSMLQVSGQLNPQMGGRGFFPQLSSEVLAGQSKPGWGWDVSSLQERNRRSIYIFTKRGVRDPLLEAFDYVNTTSPLGVRPVTTVAPQALVLLNGQFVQGQALALAKRVRQTVGDLPTTSVRRLYRLAFGREPNQAELDFAIEYLARQEAEFERTQGIVTFKPDVPDALMSDYRKLLDSHAYVRGPRDTWSYYPGRWVGGYEGIDALDNQRVPFALWMGTPVTQGTVRGRLLLHNATRFGSLLVHSQADGEMFSGMELRFSPGDRSIRVLQHTPDQLQQLGAVPLDVNTSQWIDFRVELVGGKVRLFAGDERTTPIVETEVADPGTAAHLGIAVSRGAVSLDDLVVEAGGTHYDVSRYKVDAVPTSLQALQTLCVVLLNTSEFLYVD